MDGLIAHPDIMNEERGEGGEEGDGEPTEAKTNGQSVIVELKDTVNGKRLDITDQKFTSYLRQLMYYLVMTGIEKGIISIRYNSRELRWTKSDSEGDYFFRPYNGRDDLGKQCFHLDLYHLILEQHWQLSLAKDLYR
jgi:hypothetical protein